MCGIAGIIGTRDDVTPARLSAFAGALAHRGPDGAGADVVGDGVGLVHTRLAIIDLSPAGRQPMRDAAGNWVTFNGELYNYRALRAELEHCGRSFHSQSDTEVLLAAYAQWGAACVERFDGMFAFGLWDASARTLLLATDRFGIKPVYWWCDGRRFAFASEVRALLTSGLVPRVVNRDAVASFFAFGAVQAPVSIIVGVSQLLPGHRLCFDAQRGTAVIERYWAPPAPDASPASADDVAVALRAALERHLVADVPVGLFLSGGVDSSALAALAHRAGVGEALTAFTVTFAERAYAEGAIARTVGERFCGAHRELLVTDADLARDLPASLAAQDQPTIDGTNVFIIARAARNAGMKTVLSGQGGDEVFGGYETFRRLPRMLAHERYVAMLPRAVRTALAAGLLARAAAHPARAKMAAYLTAERGAAACYAITRQLFHAQVRALLQPEWRTAVGVTPWYASDLIGRDPYHATSVLEFFGYLANTLLRDGDVMSMAHGLEVRVPYLDHHLVETVLRVPTTASQHGAWPKALLLDAVRDMLPRAVYDRKKMGFTFPWETWLRGRLRPFAEETLAGFPADNALGVHRGACVQLWQDFLAHRGSVTWARAWAPIALMRWADRNL
ncbi:MAG: asparagine synthase (glutamine-hydrolyzing) [bacterium]|nr:asparagine synthase (glutamine-hydrolyzing) [bacterium]